MLIYHTTFYLDAIKSEKNNLRKKWGYAKEKKVDDFAKRGLFAKIISLLKVIPLSPTNDLELAKPN